MKSIPNVIHFIFGLEPQFGGKPFGLVHYLAVKSAYVVNKPDKIYFYYKYQPKGYWWEMIRKYITPIKVCPPKEVYGRMLHHFAHKADVLRLMILTKYGGIYLDLDTICVKPFTNLLDNKFLIGVQGQEHLIEGLCNAVMLSQPNALFPKVWLKYYKGFRSKGRDKYWCEHSVLLPAMLAQEKNLVSERTIVPYNFFHYPLYSKSGLEVLFERDYVFKDAYCHHLWESISYEKYLKRLTINDIKSSDTTYNRIARRFVSVRKTIRLLNYIPARKERI